MVKQTAGRDALGEFAPKFAQLNDDECCEKHGAKRDCWFSHIAIEVPGENTSNEWCEHVSDEEYNNL